MPLVQGRKRRQQNEDDDDDDAEISARDSPEPPTQRRRTGTEIEGDEAYGNEDGSAEAVSYEQMVKKLVRLALACEYQRKPIRRADISEKVLGASGARQFKNVFQAAQAQLGSVFGMAMVELPARDKITIQQKRAAAKSATQGQKSQSSSSVAWVLTSVLPSEYHDPEIRVPPAAPTNEEDGKYTAIYSTLIALISLSGGQLPDAKMERYLQRLNMQDNTPVMGSDKTEKLLKRLEKEQYVVKIKESGGGQEQDIYWVVGPRGKVEVGNDGVRGLVKAVYGFDEDDERFGELEKKLSRSLGIPDPTGEQHNGVNTGVTGQNSTHQRKPGRPRRRQEEDEEDGSDDDDDDDDGE